MSAGRFDLIIEQGATYTQTFTYETAAGVPINLTAYTAAMQIRESVESTAVLATSSGTSPSITLTLGGSAGTIIVTMTATVTAAFAFDTAVYDLELTTGTTVLRLLEGEVKLSKEVTR